MFPNCTFAALAAYGQFHACFISVHSSQVSVYLIQGRKHDCPITALWQLVGNFMFCPIPDHSFSVCVHLLQREEPFQECLFHVATVRFRILPFRLPYCVWLPNNHRGRVLLCLVNEKFRYPFVPLWGWWS